MITAVMLAAVLIVYFTGLAVYGTNRSAFSILAAVGALPTGNSVVNLVMLLRASGCTRETETRIRGAAEGLAGCYDLYLTSYDKNYSLSHASAAGRRICGLTEDAGTDCGSCAAHIRTVLEKNGHSGYQVEITRDPDKYDAMLLSLKEEAEGDGDPEAVLRSMLAASL